MTSLTGQLSRLFLVHGDLVRFCVCKTKVALSQRRECLQHPGLVNITGQVLLYVLHSLGLVLPSSQEFVFQCNRYSQTHI